jgi:hypothetical protein
MNRHVTRTEYRVVIARPDGSRYTEWRLTQEAADKYAARPGHTVVSITRELRELDW